jgi:hypothetical protein
MKQFVSKLPAILFLVLLLVFITGATTPSGDKELVEKAVMDNYIKGLQIRDFNLITTICNENAMLYGVRSDGTLSETSLEKWSKRFDPENPPFQKLDYTIEKVDVVNNAAQVKILFEIDEKKEVYDFLNMLKINGQWRIVNIIDTPKN